MKKILVSCIGTNLGGIERSLIEFLKYVSEQDCEVDLIHWKKPGELYNQIPKNVNILSRLSPMGFSDIRRLKNPVKIIKELMWLMLMKVYKLFYKPWKCFKRLKKHYDVAISYCQNGYSPYYVIDKVNADKKYLWYHHGSYEANETEHKINKKYYSCYDKVIAVSMPCKEMLENYFSNCNIDVIHNIIDVEGICTKAQEIVSDMSESAKYKLVTVSRYSYEKGIDIAIETSNHLKEHKLDFCWYFVGEGPYRKKAEDLIMKYGLEKQCILLGAKSNPYPYIKNADIYVQTSRVEAHPITILEALVLKKIIVASNIPAILKVTKKGIMAQCAELEPSVLAEMIKECCLSSKKRESLLQVVESSDISNRETFNLINNLLDL